MSDWYILDKDRNPVPASIEEWEAWRRSSPGGDPGEEFDGRRVALDERDGVRVSTVFLGLDHGWGDGPPVLFETMIFGGPHEDYQTRCSTWDEAEKMHEEAVRLAFGGS